MLTSPLKFFASQLPSKLGSQNFSYKKRAVFKITIIVTVTVIKEASYKTLDDNYKSSQVKELINNIGTVTYSNESKKLIDNAKTEYDKLSTEAKALFVAEPHVAHDAQTTTWLAKAAQRYDYIIERFGTNPYNDFIGRINSQHIVPHQGAIINSITNSSSATTIVIIITVVATLSVVGFVVFKKKHN